MATKETLVSTQSINTSVDMKITKADLVEMFMAEREEEIQQDIDILDLELKAKNEASKKLATMLLSEGEKIKTAFINLAKKFHQKRIKGAEIAFDTKATYEANPARGNYMSYDAERWLHDPSKSKHKTMAVTARVISKIKGANYSIQTEHWSITYKPTNKEIKSVPAFKNVNQLAKERKEISESIALLQEKKNVKLREKHSLAAMGARAKAKWVRSILEQTTDGAEMLSAIAGKIKQGNKLLKKK